jgi:hypothetical protein
MEQNRDLVTCHLEKALEEYAASLGKPVAELNLAQRNQAFYNYRLEGRHMESLAETKETGEVWG